MTKPERDMIEGTVLAIATSCFLSASSICTLAHYGPITQEVRLRGLLYFDYFFALGAERVFDFAFLGVVSAVNGTPR